MKIVITRSWLACAARRFVALSAALVLVITTVGAGAHYFYCLHSGLAHRARCCGSAAHGAAPKSPDTRRSLVASRACCEERVVPASAAQAAQAPVPAVPTRALVAAQDAWGSPIEASLSLAVRLPDWPIRAGPEYAQQRCALLQVFLT